VGVLGGGVGKVTGRKIWERRWWSGGPEINVRREDEKSFEVITCKSHESAFCHRCKVVGHYTKECKRVWQGIKEEVQQGNRDQNLSEYVATLCATQVEGMAFFCSPNRPSQNHAKERVNTAIVTVLKGSITAKQLEEEFTRILSGVWRWTARRVADNKFTVRFPNVQLIQEWAKFNPVKMRTVKAKIQIETWNDSIGAKAELQHASFRVRNSI
jgi:hypothetical protein